MDLLKSGWMLWTIKLAVLGIFLYLGLRWFERSNLYFPSPTLTVHPGTYGLPYKEASFEAEDGTLLYGWLIPAQRGPLAERELTVLFFHGNAGNISHRMEKAVLFNRLGVGIFPEKRIPVVIFTTQEFWEAWHAPDWLGGFFDRRDGRIRVRIDLPSGGEAEYRRRLRHEYTHAFFHHLYPKDLPIWFHEGAAQFYSYADSTNSFWKDNRLEELRRMTKGAPWMTMERLERVLKKKDVQPGMVYLGYLQAEALALYLAKERGDSWIPNVMQRLRKGLTFESAFQEVIGVSADVMLERIHQQFS